MSRAAATVEVQAGFLLPLALTLLVLGVLITAGAVVLIVIGAPAHQRQLTRRGHRLTRRRVAPGRTGTGDTRPPGRADRPARSRACPAGSGW